MNSINPTNNVNFNARLKIGTLKTDKARWENIAKIFEEKTAKQYPNDWFVLESTGKKRGMRISDGEAELNNGDGCIMDERLYDKLMKLSDDKIAGKFKKLMTFLYRPAGYATKIAAKVRKLVDENGVKKEFESLGADAASYNNYYKAIDDFELMIFSAVESNLRNKANKSIAKDSILKHLDISCM